MKIESLQNSKVKEWVKLKDKKYRDSKGLFIAEGDHLLKEALKKGIVMEIISNDKSFEIDDIPFYEVSDSILKKISSQVSGTNVISICKMMEEREIKGNVCLLDSIQDPGNLGTIIRSALAFNIDTIIMSPDTVSLYNEKVIRSSEGMLFHINFKVQDIGEAINMLKKDNYIIYGTDVKNGTQLKKLENIRKCAIIIGNEGKGMNDNLKDMCDVLLNIPINKNCESLNAGVAASIIFYELNR